MSILTPRLQYKPFEYPQFIEFADLIRKTFWTHDEVNFQGDVHAFKVDLTEVERYVIAQILKSFAQTEIHVADDFWAYLTNVVPKPECKTSFTSNSENEYRHAEAYDHLNDLLQITDYAGFIQEVEVHNRIHNLMEISKDEHGRELPPTPAELLKKIAVFSAVTEWTGLFSQFAVLRSFSANGRNLLIGIGDIIHWSAIDEQNHALVGFELAHILKQEFPEVWTEELQDELSTLINDSYQIEVELMDQVFKHGDLPNLTRKQLENFTKNRINEAKHMLGLPAGFEVDKELLKEMDWFMESINMRTHGDFFSTRPSDYTKGLTSITASDLSPSREYIQSISKL